MTARTGPQSVAASAIPDRSLPSRPLVDLPALLAAALGVAWLLAHTGAGVLDPTDSGWLRLGDWSAGYFGWTFFRTAPFSFPLGASPDYPFPIGSTLALSDSLPILGVLLRPFASVLPRDFQYVGPWLALCFALQGFVGAKLVRLASEHAPVRLLGGALFAMAPPLLHRVLGPDTGHASLTAQWILLALLWLALAQAPGDRIRCRLAFAAGLLFLSAGLHPYLTVAGLALAVAFVVRLAAVDRSIRWPSAALASLGLAALSLASLALFGFLGGAASLRSSGFGHYSADGLTLLNPMGWSRIASGFRVGPGQYEGFAWLGLGVLLLAAVALGLVVALRARLGATPWSATLPALVAALLLAFFSLSDSVTIAGTRVVSLGFWSRLPLIAGTFRSSGRFVWSLHYLSLLAAIAGVSLALRARPRILTAALAATLAIQLADLRPPAPMERVPADFARVRSDLWSLARGSYRHVALYPPSLRVNSAQFRQVGGGCAGVAGDELTVLLAADVAGRIGATFNSGYLARIDAERAMAACTAQREAIAAGALDPETLYVVQPVARQQLRTAHARCSLIDGLIACVRGDRDDPFARALSLKPFE